MLHPILSSGNQNSVSQSFLPDIRTTVEMFGIHLRTVNRHWSYPSHEHLHYEINYVIDGEQFMTVDGRRYRQRVGEFMLIRPCSPHFSAVGNSDGCTYFCVHFIVEGKLFLPLLGQVEDVLFPSDSPLNIQLRPSLDHLIQLAKQDHGTDDGMTTCRLHVQAAALQLMAELFKHLSSLKSEYANPGPVKLARLIEDRISSSLNAVKVHGDRLNRKTYIHDIANDLDIHPSYCTRVFRSVYGISPRQYMSELVLDHAKTMLSQLELSIEHIATVLGYVDTSQFSRQFKRWTGQSPNQFRHGRMESDSVSLS